MDMVMATVMATGITNKISEVRIVENDIPESSELQANIKSTNYF